MVKERNISEDVKVKEAESKLNIEFVEHEYPTLGVVRIHHPSLQVSNEIDMFYTEEFNRLLMDTKLPTINELDDRLRDRGSWTEDHDDKITNFQEVIRNTYYDIQEAQYKMGKQKTKIKKKPFVDLIEQLNKKVLKYNTQYIKLITLKTQLFVGTVEKQAEGKSIYKKMTLCVTDEADKPLWDSVEDLMTKNKTKDVELLFTDAETFWAGLSDPLSAQLLDQVYGD